jgi:hypothetical protein
MNDTYVSNSIFPVIPNISYYDGKNFFNFSVNDMRAGFVAVYVIGRMV